MDAGETPLRGDLYQVGPPEAVGQHLAHVLLVVEQVLAVGEISGGLSEMEEGLVEVKAVMEVPEALRRLAMGLILIRLPKPVIVGSPLLI